MTYKPFLIKIYFFIVVSNAFFVIQKIVCYPVKLWVKKCFSLKDQYFLLSKRKNKLSNNKFVDKRKKWNQIKKWN